MFGIDFDDGKATHHILDYWRKAEPQYPTLAAIARDYLAIPAAGVGVERLFSTARDICTYRRYRLKPSSVKLLMMTISIYRFDTHLRETKNYMYDDSDDEAESEENNDVENIDEANKISGLISEDEEEEADEGMITGEDLQPRTLPTPKLIHSTTGLARRQYLLRK